MNRRTFAAIALAITAALLFGAESCDSNTAPQVESDSNQSYDTGGKSSRIPVDDHVYEVTGEVVGPVNTVTRQVKPAEGSSSGYIYGMGGGSLYGSSSGSYFGEVTKGKGYVRLLVQSVSPATPSATAGAVSILKVTDTKATALIPGDVVTFKCRRQYEAIAAVRDNQTFNAKNKALETWELDYCRMETAVISVTK
jgi:hypothetical protein